MTPQLQVFRTDGTVHSFEGELSEITSSPVDADPHIAATGSSRNCAAAYISGGLYGPRKGGKLHDGIDIVAEPNESCYSIRYGKVTNISNGLPANKYKKNSYGNTLTIETELWNGSTLSLKYAHLNRVDVKLGQTVYPGQQIGLTGMTGNAAPNPDGDGICHHHCHINAKLNGKSVDPVPYTGFKFDSSGCSSPSN